MRCNRHYMNGPNLNENEKIVLGQFRRHGKGVWLSRQFLENDLLRAGGLDQRTLDRILSRLVKWRYIVKTPTKDRGALYALSPTSENEQGFDEFARECDTRGMMVKVEPLPPTKCPYCGSWLTPEMATEFGKLEALTDEDATELMRKHDEAPDETPLIQCPVCRRWLTLERAFDFGKVESLTDEQARELIRKHGEEPDRSP